MPGTEELLARLQQLEDGYYGDKEAARQQQFFDTYGGRFSNNRGLGLAILNELDARGIDTSAADEAVQQILDQLRTECNEIIESIKDVQQTAIDTAQKVEEINNVVSDAVANNPDATMPNEMPMMSPDGGAPMPNEMPPADQGMPMPEEVPADQGMLPDDEEEEMPADQGMPMPEEVPADQGMPDNTVLSDARLKRIKSAISSVRAKRNSYKPSEGILNAARGIR